MPQTNSPETLLLEFYTLKKKIDDLTVELNTKKEQVLAHLKLQPGMKTSIGEGENAIGFYVRSTPVYEFTEVVGQMELKVKDVTAKIKTIKDNEIKSGEAKIVNTQYAVCVK